MKTPKLITNYEYLSDGELANMATRTADALRDNTNFPDMVPTFEEYETVALDYVAKQAITALARPNTQQAREKDEARDLLIDMMRRVTSYINNFTKLSSVQLSSGFEPVPPAKSKQVPRSPEWAKLADSNRPGELRLLFKSVKEAVEYEVDVTSEVDENGQPIWGTPWAVPRANGNYYGPVEDAVVYYFRVRSRNKKGVSNWTYGGKLRARVDS